MDLNDLDSLFTKQGSNPKCEGCSILGKIGQHGIDDFENADHSDILFLSGSYNLVFGELMPFRHEEFKVLQECIANVPKECKVFFSTAVKCPNIRDADMCVADRNICRKHVENTIDKSTPKLVFVCGELAYLMLFKKKGCSKHRGTQLEYVTPNGTKTIVVPLFHPWQVVAEPKNKYLFQLDIINAVNAVVLGKETQGKLEYDYVDTLDKLLSIKFPSKGVISVDIETTGLNFLTDKINTIAFSWRQHDRKIKSICIPLEHKDSPFDKNSVRDIIEVLKPIFWNKDLIKVGQNFKFDLRFLARYGIKEVVSAADTKLMAFLVDENLPRSLKDLVGYYLPLEMKKFNANS